MQCTEQQFSEFKAEFARRRKRQLLGSLPVVAVFIFLAFFNEKVEAFLGLPPSVVLGAAFAMVAALVAFSLWNWRCPACNRYLGKGVGQAFCPKCGVPLR